jgi:hypothetical protein
VGRWCIADGFQLARKYADLCRLSNAFQKMQIVCKYDELIIGGGEFDETMVDFGFSSCVACFRRPGADLQVRGGRENGVFRRTLQWRGAVFENCRGVWWRNGGACGRWKAALHDAVGESAVLD